MNKHTKGPWNFRLLDTNSDWIVIDGPGNAKKIALVGAEYEDAARLIAAAPDLLEALRAFTDFPADTFDGPGHFTMTVSRADLRRALAAITKATGNNS